MIHCSWVGFSCHSFSNVGTEMAIDVEFADYHIHGDVESEKIIISDGALKNIGEISE